MRPLLRFSTLLALVTPPAAASAQVYAVPVRWCVVADDANGNGRFDPGERGAPAFTNPGHVGEVDTDNVLWRRHERSSDAVFIPEAQVTFRSAIYNIVEDAGLRFPIIPDPDPDPGTPGNVYGDIVATPGTSPSSEWNAAHNACVNAWREAHGVGDIGVVVINANNQRTYSGDSQPGIAAVGGRRMLLRDNAYLLPGSPLYNAVEFPVADHVDKHFGHEMGHALASLEHTCSVQNLMSTSRRDTDGDARVDNIHLSTSILQGTPAATESCTSSVNQVQAIRAAARAAPGCKIAGTNTDCTVMSDVRADRIRDAPFPLADLSLFYATRDGETVRLVHEPMGPLGRSDYVGFDEFLDFYSFIDKDRDPATGGGAEQLGVPVRFDGAEFATRVRIGMDRQGSFTFLATAWHFAGGAFTEVIDRRIRGYAAPVRVLSETEEVRLTDKVTIEVPASVFGSGLSGFRVQAAVVHVRERTPRVLDLLDEDPQRPGRTFRWESPTFPVCSVTPGTAPRLGAITILSTGLLPDRPVHLIFGDRHVANGHAGADGSVTITTAIPAGVRDGQHLITVGTDGTALTADCIADVRGGPRPPPEDGGTNQPGDGRERGLAFSFHVGSSHPVRGFDDRADANIHLRLDASYALSSRLRTVAFLGFSQFTDDGVPDAPEWWANASLNLQALFPAASGMRYFLQAGPGAYVPKAGGGPVLGANVGLGGQIPLASGPFALEFGADYHQVFGDHDLGFVTAQLGVIWR
jgi:hypothetical protein